MGRSSPFSRAAAGAIPQSPRWRPRRRPRTAFLATGSQSRSQSQKLALCHSQSPPQVSRPQSTTWSFRCSPGARRHRSVLTWKPPFLHGEFTGAGEDFLLTNAGERLLPAHLMVAGGQFIDTQRGAGTRRSKALSRSRSRSRHTVHFLQIAALRASLSHGVPRDSCRPASRGLLSEGPRRPSLWPIVMIK